MIIIVLFSYIICSITSASEIYLVIIINNLGQGEAGSDLSEGRGLEGHFRMPAGNLWKAK